MIALNWGTPTPAIILVVQIEPGPIPIFIASTGSFMRSLAASLVAIFPAIICMLFFTIFLKPFIVFITLSECA